MELCVRAIETLTPRVKAFELATTDGETLPTFAAGAHIRVAVRDRMGAPGERAYALYNRSGEGIWRIAVQFDPDGRGGSRYLHETVRVGDRLVCSGPYGTFALAEAATEHVLIAQGIGIAPIFAMTRALAAKRRTFAVHYNGQTRADMPLADAVLAAAKDRAHLYVGDDAFPLAAILGAAAVGRHAYVCGPDATIAATREAAAALGWAAGNLHAERLVAPVPRCNDRPATVVLARSGLSLTVPADRSVLDSLIDAGLQPPFDCRRGACGACVQTVIEAEGGIDHRDRYLTALQRAEGHSMCVCVSRPKGSRLVLDL